MNVGPARNQALEPPLRLDDDVVPFDYRIDLVIDPAKPRFAGKVEIDVNLRSARRWIWIHGRDLEVSSAFVLVEGRRVLAKYDQLRRDGTAVLDLERSVGPGRATIEMVYEAPFSDDLSGLYRVDAAGSSYAFTQFEPIDARRCFPSFDEPRFKATFEVNIDAPEGNVVVSSGPSSGTSKAQPGFLRTRFEKTPPIASYAIAFAVGPLDVVSSEIPANEVRDRPIPFRALALKGKGARLSFAVEQAPNILAALERYFDMPYPYAKLDLIAVPEHAFGAMENVGAVTYREDFILFDETSTEETKEFHVWATAHELAHMWFGNLVTMPWWDDFWLNEAFASWMGLRILDEVRPDAGADAILMQWIGDAVRVDRRVSARQIRQPIESSDEIRNAIDPITYWKGAALLRMIESWLGRDAFRDGLRSYVRRFRFKTATYQDLSRALSEAAGRDVSRVLDSFLLQPGLPMLSMKSTCPPAAVLVEQSRYAPLGMTPSAATWTIPVCLGSDPKARPSCTIVEERTTSLPMDRCAPDLQPNPDGAGYFVFTLSDWSPVLKRWSSLSVTERISATWSLDAAFASGKLETVAFIDALAVLARDPELQIIREVMRHQAFLKDHVVARELEPRVEAWSRATLTPTWERIGLRPVAGEATKVSRLRDRLAQHLIEMNDQAVIEALAAQGRRLMGDHPETYTLGPELREPSLGAAVRSDGPKAFDRILELLFASTDSVERARYLNALGWTRDHELKARLRALALDPRLGKNEILQPLWAHGRWPEDEYLDFLRTNYEAVVARLPESEHPSVPWLFRLCDQTRVEEIANFFEDRVDHLVGGRRALAETLDDMRICGSIASAHRVGATAYFSNQPAK